MGPAASGSGPRGSGGVGWGSHAADRGDPAGGDGLGEGGEVPLVLVGVGGGELAQRQVEAIAPAEAASVMLLKEKMQDVLKNLTERERKVLVLRFGLEDGHQRTLEEVGQEFGVTRERIRQIEAKALRKLRHPSRGKALKDYWSNE